MGQKREISQIQDPFTESRLIKRIWGGGGFVLTDDWVRGKMINHRPWTCFRGRRQALWQDNEGDSKGCFVGVHGLGPQHTTCSVGLGSN